MASAVPKQFLDLGGRSLLQRSVAVFDRHGDVAQIVVVLPSDLVAAGRALVGDVSRPCAIVAGGDRRQDSVANGVAALAAQIDTVLVHDAARPFADAALIDRVLAGVRESGAAIPAIGVRDTVKRRAAGSSRVAETIPRGDVWLAQTPQGFRRPLLESAMALARTGADATDEAALVERLGEPVAIVEGDERNVKITTPDDLATARAALAAPVRIGTGYDLHRLVTDRPLVLAGVVVPSPTGPLGHSDADVLCHAIADAMFGACGNGDIGRHFPDSDPQWKGIPGLDLLAKAAAIVRSAGWVVSNVDATIVLERPKLAPHIPAMRDALARALAITPEAVGVKAKTNEGVDAVGRGEAIVAHAAVILAPAANAQR
jgi:2-C-methyl-D-erythritol 4-phosphate cytidylyltransferase/2-C-methyl-D-erythritol 2,4-cyclodiphosphate synthase